MKRSTIAIGGTPCVDFSSFGSSEGVEGRTLIHLIVWIEQRRLLSDTIWVHENVPSFAVDLLRKLLGDVWIIETMVISPVSMGWPIRRPRRWTVGRHRQWTIKCYSSLQLYKFLMSP